MSLFSRLLIVCLLFCLAGGSVAAAQPREVTIDLALVDIDEIDNVSQSFVANFILAASWRDPGLAHPGPGSISRDLDAVWYPAIMILNEQNLRRTFPAMVEIQPDGTVLYRQRYWGSLSQPLELRRFPFDSQRLEITLLALNWGNHPVVLRTGDRSGLLDRLRIPDWNVTSWGIESTQIDPGAVGAPMPAVVFSLDVDRDRSFFRLKVMIPLLLIVAMSWLVFWLDPALVAPRISVAVTAMLTLIAYRFAIGAMVPRLPFLTSLDYFVLGSSVLVFVGLAVVVWSTQQQSAGHTERALAIDRRARWAAPLLYALLIAETLFLHVFD